MMEIVFVRPSMQPRNFFQGHGESVQKSGYLQEERVEFVWEKQQQKKLGLKSVSQSVDELRETFTCWEGLLFVIFSLLSDFVYCNILMGFQWINLYNSYYYYYESCYMNDYLHHQQQHHPGIQTFLSLAVFTSLKKVLYKQKIRLGYTLPTNVLNLISQRLDTIC
jgi:hypothetical protein